MDQPAYLKKSYSLLYYSIAMALGLHAQQNLSINPLVNFVREQDKLASA